MRVPISGSFLLQTGFAGTSRQKTGWSANLASRFSSASTILASLLGFGSISYLYFADRIAQLPLGIIGIALSTALLTSLSKSSAIKDKKQFSKELMISIKIGLFFSIPSSFVFINFSDLFISVLFERGEFSSLETNQTAQALIAYAFGIPAFIILKSCQPAFPKKNLHKGHGYNPMHRVGRGDAIIEPSAKQTGYSIFHSWLLLIFWRGFCKFQLHQHCSRFLCPCI